jgi:hypothetical protein
MGKEKIKLMTNNNKRKMEEVPLTNDMIMDDENETHKTKYINPNQGYKLADKNQKKPQMDVDEQVIKGIEKDFDDIVNEKVGKDGGIKQGNMEEDEDEEIPANEYKKAEPLIPVLGNDLVKLLFSKYWRKKEEGIKQLTEEIKNHPHGLLSQFKVDKILTGIAGASAYVLGCNVSQPLMAVMDLLKIAFNKFRGSNSSIQGYMRQEFDNFIDQCMLHLLERVGDSTLKMKERAENTVLELANSSLIGHKVVFEGLITGQVKKTLANSPKHLSGRLSLISRMIDNFGVNILILIVLIIIVKYK